jgi:hypothetical protein
VVGFIIRAGLNVLVHVLLGHRGIAARALMTLCRRHVISLSSFVAAHISWMNGITANGMAGSGVVLMAGFTTARSGTGQ